MEVEIELEVFWNPERFRYPAIKVDNKIIPLTFKNIVELSQNLGLRFPSLIIKGSNVMYTGYNSNDVYVIDQFDEKIKNIELPNDLEDYQKRAIILLLRRHKVVLALPTGTGKTRILIEALKVLKSKKEDLKALVIVPQKSLIANWERELEKWRFDGKIELQNIHKLIRDEELRNKLASQQWDVLILDEGHEILKNRRKGKKSIRIVYAISKNAKRIWVATATPIVNDLFTDASAYFSLFDVVNRTKLTKGEMEIVKKIIKWYVYFEPVTKELEEVREIEKIEIQDKNAIKLYNLYLDALKKYALALFREEISMKQFEIQVIKLIAKYLKYGWYYWNGFSRDPKSDKINWSHPKILKLKEILSKIDDKVIVFGFHQNFFKVVKKIAEDLKRPYFEISGKTSRKAKQIMSEFKKTKNGILAIGIKAGGVGLDFPETNYAIFYEYWWTFASIYQAESRILRRFSPNKKKKIYYLISVLGHKLEKYSTIDVWMMTKILGKAYELEEVLKGEDENKKSYIKELLKDLTKLQ